MSPGLPAADHMRSVSDSFPFPSASWINLHTPSNSIPTDLKMDSEDEYKRLAALILLSDKYQLESIGNHALDCLKTAYTNSFERWDARPEADGLHVRADWQPSTGHRLRAIDVVHLAHITNTPSVLPLAFYHCALLGDKVADGWTREDGTVQRLAPEDLERALGGHKYLCEKTSGFLTSLFRATPSAPCMTRIMCGGLLEVLEEKGADVYKTPALLDRPDGWTFRTPLCRPCTRELEEREKAERRALWKKLPEIFRLGEGMKVWEA